MVDVTDAAVEALAKEFIGIYYDTIGDVLSGMTAIASHVLTSRQPKPEDVERLAGIVWPWIKPVNWAISAITPWENVVTGSLDHQAALGCARALIDAYDPPPARHAPTPADLGRINAILQPFLGQMHVRDKIAEAFLAEFSAPPPAIKLGASGKTLADAYARLMLKIPGAPCSLPDERIATTEAALDRLLAERDAAKCRIATLEAELAVAKCLAKCRTTELEAELAAAQSGAPDAPPADFGMMAMADRNGELVMNLLARSDGISRRAAAEILGTRARIATLEAEPAAAHPGTIRLGEGLTEAQEGWSAEVKIKAADKFGVASNALGALPFFITMTEGYDAWNLIRRRLNKYEAALRASAAPKPDPVDWVQKAAEYQRKFAPAVAKEIMAGLCEQITALQAKGGV